MNKIILISLIFFFTSLIQIRHGFYVIATDEICQPPRPCKFSPIHQINGIWLSHLFSTIDRKGIICHVTSSTRFETIQRDSAVKKCANTSFEAHVDIVSERNDPEFILIPSLNLLAVIEFISLWNFIKIYLKFVNIRKFSIHLNATLAPDIYQAMFFVNDVDLEFYDREGRLIKSCKDLNQSAIDSVFQLTKTKQGEANMLNCRYRTPVCPWLFKNTNLTYVEIRGMSNTYMKHNVLKFTGENLADFSSLNSNIENLNTYRLDNVALDSSLVHPSVFKSLKTIVFTDGPSQIGNDFLAHFKCLEFVKLEASVFRKLMHSQGIDWIRSKNINLRVNMSNVEEIRHKKNSFFFIGIGFRNGQELKDAIPDEDLCLFEHFPFEQMIYTRLIFDLLNGRHAFFNYYMIDAQIWSKRTCTLEFLAQHFVQMNQADWEPWAQNLSEAIRESDRVCDFTSRLRLCNKTKFTPKHLWTIYDWFILNKTLQMVCDILIFVFSLFGIVTNLVVVFIIVREKNSDLFKGCRQYDYLCWISGFNIAILLIQLASWISDCKETLDVFCPKTRRYIPVQFFKIILKETIVPTLRFMSNFSYVAFAFNRISLIGKDHPKLVEYFCKKPLKPYLIVTAVLSIILSLVKLFKYKINYDHNEREYPYTVEGDFYQLKSLGEHVYYVINVICDFLNYLVFVGINLGIDVYMVVRLRRTLDEKLKRLDAITVNDDKTKQYSDMSNAKNNALRMVVLNSTLNLLFKLPLMVISLINAVVVFQYKDYSTNGISREFQVFYERASRVHFLPLFNDFADLLYTVLIALQLVFYKEFDGKISKGFDRILKPQVS